MSCAFHPPLRLAGELSVLVAMSDKVEEEIAALEEEEERMCFAPRRAVAHLKAVTVVSLLAALESIILSVIAGIDVVKFFKSRNK